MAESLFDIVHMRSCSFSLWLVLQILLLSGTLHVQGRGCGYLHFRFNDSNPFTKVAHNSKFKYYKIDKNFSSSARFFCALIILRKEADEWMKLFLFSWRNNGMCIPFRWNSTTLVQRLSIALYSGWSQIILFQIMWCQNVKTNVRAFESETGMTSSEIFEQQAFCHPFQYSKMRLIRKMVRKTGGK